MTVDKMVQHNVTTINMDWNPTIQFYRIMIMEDQTTSCLLEHRMPSEAIFVNYNVLMRHYNTFQRYIILD